MTRKDYVAIADAFNNGKPPTMIGVREPNPEDRADRTWVILRSEVANVLAADNPRFDRERFYAACEGK